MTTIENLRTRFGIPGSVLKLIAIISMLIDHTGAVVVRRLAVYASSLGNNDLQHSLNTLYKLMRHVGRIAFPIFCFLLVEGFIHTKNIRKYALRMFLFACISEFPFDYALHRNQPLLTKQNVYFTLLIGLLVLWGIKECTGKITLQMMILSLGMIGAYLLRTDYSFRGVFVIELMYLMRFSWLYQCGTGAAFFYNYEGLYGAAGFLPIALYNGKRGRQMKYFYYWFYPAHLLILGIATHVILNSIL